MILFNKNLFKYSFVSIVLIELLSFLFFQYPAIEPWIFSLVALAALAATIKNLEWGICIVFAELVIGSFGKILVLPVGDWQLPIRMVLWGIVMVVWLVNVVKKRRIEFFHSQLFKPYLILAAVLGWGIVWGILRGNNLGAIFFDVNNYLYFALVFPVYEIFMNAPRRVPTIILSAIAWLSVKTILLFYIFSHELFGLQDVLYAWSRKMQLAEITNIDPNAIISRIFIQSQIWILFGLFVGLAVILNGAKRSEGSHGLQLDGAKTTGSLGKLGMTWGVATLVLFCSALVMSFSRSFWLAGLLSLLFGAILLLFFREKFKSVLIFGATSLGIIGAAVLLTFGVAKFPFPPGISSSDFLKNRASQFKEAAANSRVAQIRPLLTGIAKHPALGSGFGTAITYQSQDPRVLKNHPDGWYTTTAFELGWLEMWLKIGLFGVAVYFYLLWKILKSGLWLVRHPEPAEGSRVDRYLILGGLIGLVAVAITHGLSPYLNHPLGIGVVILFSAIVDKKA